MTPTRNEKRHVVPTTPSASPSVEDSKDLAICKQLGLITLPPDIPAQGLAVPEPIFLYATKVRKLIRTDPENVPFFLHVWIRHYENAHPYGFAKDKILEERWNNENYTRLAAESPEIEEAKGNKTFKILDSVGQLVKAGGATYKDAFEVVLAAFEAGANVAINATKNTHTENAATFTNLRGVISDLSKNLQETIAFSATERKALYDERSELYDEHAEFLGLLKEAKEGKSLEVSESRMGLLFGGFQKVAGMFAPALKKQGIDISPLLAMGKEKPALDGAAEAPEGDEAEEEEGQE